MKRKLIALALAIACLPLAFAEKRFDAPMNWYEPAHIGFDLPSDAEIEDEDEAGLWAATSEEAGFHLFFQEAEEYVEPEDIGEESLLAAFEGEDIEDFTFLDVVENDEVTYAYGQGTTTLESGEELECMIGILTNTDVPDATFQFVIMAESLISEDTGPAVEDFIDDIVSMEPLE